MSDHPAHAQTIAPQDLPTIQNQQNTIQRGHTDDIKKRESERRQFQDTPPDGYAPPKAQAPAGLEDGACQDIATFDVQGADLIPEDVLNVITGEYAGKCLTLERINTLLADISNWYLDRGYVTTRAYLPPQDLTTGTLQIVVVEGRTEDIRFAPGQDKRNRLTTAFPGLKGNSLNIRDLEQGLDQLNRLPSNNAKLKLQPGTKTGETIVLIENEQSRRIRFSVTDDNTGARSTGVRQRTVKVKADDVFGLNDAWTLSYKPSLTDYDFYGTKSISGSVVVPYGYWAFTYSDSGFQHASTLKTTTASYASRGSNRQRDFTAERVVHRDQNSKTTLDGTLTLKETRNFIADSLLEVQSRKLSIANFIMRHTNRIQGGALNASIAYRQGLRAFGAKKDHQINSGDPRAQFRKLTSDLSYSRPFQLQEQNLNASLSASWQWAPGTLFSSERLSVGGLSSVRGFKEQSLSGDVGAYARSELSWTLPQTSLTYVDKAFGSISPYGALDAGWVQADPAEDGEGGVLSGWALGLRAFSGVINFDVAWAEPLRRHHSLTKHGRELYTSATVNF